MRRPPAIIFFALLPVFAGAAHGAATHGMSLFGDLKYGPDFKHFDYVNPDAPKGGTVREATDQEILDAKAKVGSGGLGCEPASAASVAGARKLRQEGVISADETVVCVLTGHALKDPTATIAYHTTDQKMFDDVLGSRGVRRATFANRAIQVPNDLDEIIRAIEVYS